MLFFSIAYIVGTLIVSIVALCIFTNNHKRTCDLKNTREGLQHQFQDLVSNPTRPSSSSIQRVVIDPESLVILEDWNFPHYIGKKFAKMYSSPSMNLKTLLRKSPEDLFYMVAPSAHEDHLHSSFAMIRKQADRIILMWKSVDLHESK